MPRVQKKSVTTRSKQIVHRAKRTEIVPVAPLTLSQTVEKVLIQGDLAPLTPEERVDYYKKVCASLQLNPLTSPFSYIMFKEFESGPAKLSLYANKSCAEQLRKMHGVSVVDSKRTIENECAIYEVMVQDRTGRSDSAAGIVPLFRFKDGKRIDFTGREWANAVMKAHTKAKRRATLSICGLAFLDESELDTMQVVGGVTPQGRIYTYDNAERVPESRQLDETARHGHEPGSPKAKMAEEALRKVEEEDEAFRAKNSPKSSPAPQEAAKSPLGEIELDFSAEPAYLRGDLSNLIDLLKKHTKAYWDEKEQWWRISAAEADTIRAMCQQCNYELKEIRPKVPEAKGSAPAKRGSDAGHSEPLTLSGTIERVFATIKGNKSMAIVTLKSTDGKKHEAGCWDKDIYGMLDKGKGKLAEVVIQTKGQYTNIVALVRIGSTEFVDGKVPVLQRDREPGSANTLF